MGALGLLAALSLGATTVSYTYTGDDFTTAYSPYTLGDYVSVELDFANPLAANLTNFDVSGELLNWSMTDLVQNFSSTASDELQFALISTDASGNIDQWQLVSCDVLSDCQSSNYTVATYDLTNTVIQDSGTTIDAEFATHGSNSDSPGTWAETQSQGVATPEPASAILMWSAIFAVWASKPPARVGLTNRRLI